MCLSTGVSPGYAIAVPIKQLNIPRCSSSKPTAVVDRQSFNCLSIDSSPHPTDNKPVEPGVYCTASYRCGSLRILAARFSGALRGHSRPTVPQIPTPIFFPCATACALTVRPAHAHPLNSLDAIGGRLRVCTSCVHFISSSPPRAGLDHHQSIFTSIITILDVHAHPAVHDFDRLLPTPGCETNLHRRSSRRLLSFICPLCFNWRRSEHALVPS